MVEIISKGQTDDLILVTIAIEKEPLKSPFCRENIDANYMMDEEFKQIIKDWL